MPSVGSNRPNGLGGNAAERKVEGKTKTKIERMGGHGGLVLAA
jgi:hypothetical protein